MSVSRDRVIFELPQRYYQKNNVGSGGMPYDDMCNVFYEAFGVKFDSFKKMTAGMNHGPYYSFKIMCRPSQFGRFIVHRSNINTGINGINGMKDLKCELIDEPKKKKDTIGDLASSHGLEKHVFENVMATLGISKQDVMLRFPVGQEGIWDVSQNFPSCRGEDNTRYI